MFSSVYVQRANKKRVAKRRCEAGSKVKSTRAMAGSPGEADRASTHVFLENAYTHQSGPIILTVILQMVPDFPFIAYSQ